MAEASMEGMWRDYPLNAPIVKAGDTCVGKAWEVRYTEPHPNKTFRSEEWVHKYTVVGFESVEVRSRTRTGRLW